VLTASLVAGLLGFAFTQDPLVEATEPSIKTVGERVFFMDLPFTGVLLERNLNHDLLAKTHYQNGEKEGVASTYHHNGTLVAKAYFHSGKKDGPQETWYADGKRRSLGYFRSGVAEGTYTEWHPNGKIYRLQKIENGVELENKMFYESGVIYSNYVVRDKRAYGIQGEPLCSTVKQEGFK
jgi:antitoxin component YwqK of YwqJK toxin-antitoxin module